MNLLGISTVRRIKLFNTFRLATVLLRVKKKYLRTESEFNIASSFSKYLYNEEIFKNKIGALKKNIDLESANTADKIAERYGYLFSNSIVDENQFSEEELNMQKNVKWKKIKNKYPGFKDFEISTFKFHNGLKIVPNYVLEKIKNKDCIDAGAFNGDSAIIFNKNYNFKGIYSFEPLLENFSLLQKNIKKYEAKDVFPINKGLGDKKETLGIADNGSASFIADDKNLEKIEIITIDEFVSENDLNVGLIKMDIEGFEMNALKGSINTIKKYKPVLLISIYHSGNDFFEIKPFLEKINKDYKFKIAKLNPFHLVFETMLICW